MAHINQIQNSRRNFIRKTGLGAAALSAASLVGTGNAVADTSQNKVTNLQGAGFYRLSFGEKTITVLADGNDLFPGAELFAINADPKNFAEVQASLFEPTDKANFHMNTLLIEEGDRKILIDAGFGYFLGPKFGRQQQALRNAGIKPDDIDTVIVSHGHADHFAGLVDADLNSRFPNAQIIWNNKEWDYWVSPQAVTDVQGSPLPDAFKELFIKTTQTVLPSFNRKLS